MVTPPYVESGKRQKRIGRYDARPVRSLASMRSAAAARLDWRRFDRALELTPRSDLERFGSEYGGYVLPVGLIDSDWICYSCGLGEDASFDVALIERFGCSVFAFDPTPRAAVVGQELERRQPRFRFFPYGVAATDETRRFHAPRDPAHVSHSLTDLHGGGESFEAPCRSLPSLQAELGHTRLDLLKLDIEGAEYEVLDSVLDGAVTPRIVCAEFHKVSNHRAMFDAARSLTEAGYAAVHHDRLVVTFVATSLEA